MSQDFDVLTYLSSKGHTPRHIGSTQANYACWFHGEDPQDRGRLYFNISSDAGFYFCQVCQEKGNYVTLMRHFGDEPFEKEDDETAHYKHLILQVAAEYYHNNLGVEQINWLKGRGLTVDTIKRHQIGWANDGWDNPLLKLLMDRGFERKHMVASGLIALKREQTADNELVLDADRKPYDFFRGTITLPYHSSGSVVQIRGRKLDPDAQQKYLTPPNQAARLFNVDALWQADRVVVAEGEMDTLILEQMGLSAVGVPGASTWQDSWDSYFDGVKRIYVVFDNDKAGQLGAETIKEKLGRRVRSVVLPDDGLPPGENDVARYFGQGGHSLNELVELFTKADKAGTLLVTPHEAYEQWTELQSLPGVKYGFEEFDSYMSPGHQAGQVWVVLATTNSGKTLALLNLFQGMTRADPDAKILFCSLEQTRGEWFERARRIWNFWNLDCPAMQVHEETLNYWQDRLRIVDVNRLSVESMLSAVEDFKDEMGTKPSLLAIDYLGYFARSFKGEEYQRTSDAIMTLKQVGKEALVPILTPSQVGRTQEMGKEVRMNSARGSGVVEETADMVLTMWNPDNQDGLDVSNRTGRVMMKIGKTRAGSKGRTALFQFGYLSLALAEINDLERVRLLVDEIDYDNRDDSSHVVEKWEAAIFRHRSGMKSGDITKYLMEERGLYVPTHQG